MSLRSLFQRSRFVDSRNTGSDQPNLMARPRTINRGENVEDMDETEQILGIGQ